MRLRFSVWVAVLGFLLLVMLAAVLRLLPINPWDVFWLFVAVACVWAMLRILPGEKIKR
ncbi:hypothetical protein [Methanocella conradii]|uniref:hypothetical protein n=1 Tax=Methanocella conradii TaxID=1175444 RepID=UPI0024B3A9D2|nr:hypothetical protein [Methanocella conradii]MDI6896306.1 hypothetical protein [Methanocella conradii]